MNNLFEYWQGLREACNEFHSKRSRPGGAAVCVCGNGGGGSSACNMMRILRDFFRYSDPNDPQWLELLEELKRVID